MSAEEKAAEVAAKSKEDAEQAALPYQWTQTIGDLDITTEVAGNLKSRDLVVDIKKTKLTIGIKGQEPIVTVSRKLRSWYSAVKLLRNHSRTSSMNTKKRMTVVKAQPSFY